MRLILLWGLAIGVVIACVDILADQARGTLTDTDLPVAIALLDQVIGLGLTGWVGYRVAGALQEQRPGLEAAVLAGLVAGLLGAAYQLWHTPEFSGVDFISWVAYNIVLAAAAGSLCAWVATMRRPVPPRR
jgi:hypothetical protein